MKKVILLCVCLTACHDAPQQPPQSKVAPPPTPMAQPSKAPAQPAPLPKQQPVNAVELSLKKGQTLEQLLEPYGLSGRAIFNLSQALKPYLPPNKMKIGQTFALQLQQGEVQKLVVKSGFDNLLHLNRLEDEWHLVVEKLATEQQMISKQGTINGSLYISAREQKVPVDVINRFILAFSHYVDFQRQIQKGDSFRLVYTRDCLVSDKSSHQVAKLNYAEMTLSGETIALIHFDNDQGNGAFYDETGRLAQSFLLKTPVDGARLSSHFGRRKHPILGYSRSHNGIDFGAPKGTPIMAAGNGSVEFAGRNGSFGNLVQLKHDNGYETLYAHMKGFAKGLTVGQQVKQGDIIGYVGNTGLSQSSHLHYEVHRFGKPLNPLKLKLSRPSDVVLDGEQLAAFVQHQKLLLSYFADNPQSNSDEALAE